MCVFVAGHLADGLRKRLEHPDSSPCTAAGAGRKGACVIPLYLTGQQQMQQQQQERLASLINMIDDISVSEAAAEDETARGMLENVLRAQLTKLGRQSAAAGGAGSSTAAGGQQATPDQQQPPGKNIQLLLQTTDRSGW